MSRLMFNQISLNTEMPPAHPFSKNVVEDNQTIIFFFIYIYIPKFMVDLIFYENRV